MSSSGRDRGIPWINLVLFLLTCLSTTLVGAVLMSAFRETMDDDLFVEIQKILRNPELMFSGLPFSISIMTILFAHEMGHYLTCLYYGIDATLPYFIPAPTPMGTMGAFIKIRSRIQHRSALLDVGVNGPIAGFVFAVPVLIIGLVYSRVEILNVYFGLRFGNPLIIRIFGYFMGKTPPSGMVLNLHPIALAACFGFLATMLNLLPIGQLDGGHIVYALFPNLHKRISLVLVIALVPLGIWYWPGWLLWFVMLLILRLRHFMTIDDSIPLERRHIWLAWIGLAMFLLCFMPTPLEIS